jgi:hypothetical protein
MTVTGAGRQKARMMSSPGASIVKGSRIVQWHLAGMWSAYGDGTFLLPHLESEAQTDRSPPGNNPVQCTIKFSTVSQSFVRINVMRVVSVASNLGTALLQK